LVRRVPHAYQVSGFAELDGHELRLARHQEFEPTVRAVTLAGTPGGIREMDLVSLPPEEEGLTPPVPEPRNEEPPDLSSPRRVEAAARMVSKASIRLDVESHHVVP